MIPSKVRVTSLILKATVFLSVTAGIVISLIPSEDALVKGGSVFMFFTIQSNIAIGIIALIGAVLLLKNPKAGGILFVVQFVGTVSITLTGAVFTVMLAPQLGEHAWKIANILTHVVVPTTAIADFLVIGAYGDIKKKQVFYVIIPPALYVVYAGIAYAAGWEFIEGYNYPYFFLNWGSPAGAFGFADELPYMGCVWWILVLMAFIIAVGFVYLLITGFIKKRFVERRQ
ncbi:MAG: Pr6Pr family membrane protein [Clostridia bacterium]|nr:Pr6Pr family membrane protein [Clostridia bacterium]